MKVNFSAVLNDMKNKPIPFVDGVDAAGQPNIGEMRLSDVAVSAFQQHDGAEYAASIKTYQFMLRICNGGEQEISIDEANSVLKQLAKFYGPVVVGRANELINPA